MTGDEWEASFSNIELCLRETIRFQIPTASMRKNVGREDIPIGNTGEVIPKDWVAVYLFDESHFNPQIYSEPDKWDPTRYLPDREEHMKEPHAYSCWGSGRHPCVGQRFATLEVKIITACFVALFDWKVVDGDGKELCVQPKPDRSTVLCPHPKETVRLRYQARNAEILV